MVVVLLEQSVDLHNGSMVLRTNAFRLVETRLARVA
jgi:hypothetical protein